MSSTGQARVPAAVRSEEGVPGGSYWGAGSSVGGADGRGPGHTGLAGWGRPGPPSGRSETSEWRWAHVGPAASVKPPNGPPCGRPTWERRAGARTRVPFVLSAAGATQGVGFGLCPRLDQPGSHDNGVLPPGKHGVGSSGTGPRAKPGFTPSQPCRSCLCHGHVALGPGWGSSPSGPLWLGRSRAPLPPLGLASAVPMPGPKASSRPSDRTALPWAKALCPVPNNTAHLRGPVPLLCRGPLSSTGTGPGR